MKLGLAKNERARPIASHSGDINVFAQANLLLEGGGGRGGDGEVLGQGDHLHLLLKLAGHGRPHLLGDDHRGPGVSAACVRAQHNPESPVLPVSSSCSV